MSERNINIPLSQSFETMFSAALPMMVHAAWNEEDTTMCGKLDNLDWTKAPQRRVSCLECLKQIKRERQFRSRAGQARAAERNAEERAATKRKLRDYLVDILEGEPISYEVEKALAELLGAELDSRLVPDDDDAARQFELDLIAGMRDRAAKAQAQGDIGLEIMLLNAATKMNQILNDGERNEPSNEG